MAKKPAAGKAAAKKGGKDQKKGPSNGVNKMVVLSLLVAVVPFSLPTVIVLGVGMAPTLGAYVSERGPNKYEFLCVGGLNFAGVIPYLFGLWFGVHTIDEATRILTESAMLLWAWLAAGVGWALYRAMPPLVASYMSMTTQRRINALKAAQRKLVEDWGSDVMKLPESSKKKAASA
jgi:hypothetical protein